MKKLILTLLIATLTLVSTQPTQAANCASYSDVQTNAWYCPIVTYLQDQGVLTPLPNFHPSDNLTRAAALKVIYQFSGDDGEIFSTDFFGQPANAWFTPYAQRAYAQQFIQDEDGKMDLGKPISKAEFVLLFMQTLGQEPVNSNCSIATYTINNWIATNSVEVKKYLCSAKELMQLQSVTGETIDRATAMAVLYKGMNN